MGIMVIEFNLPKLDGRPSGRPFFVRGRVGSGREPAYRQRTMIRPYRTGTYYIYYLRELRGWAGTVSIYLTPDSKK